MNLTQLRAFHLVADAESFSAAARAGAVSQPTLSGQVKALEAGYGTRLFERRGRGVQLTEMGRNLFALTQRLFALEQEAQALLAGAKALRRGHLRVSADSAYHAIPILAEMKNRHQGLTFGLKIDNSAAVLQQLLDYRADVVVTAKLTSDPRLQSLQIRRDRLIVFVATTHIWSRRENIGLNDLQGAEIVLRERGSITREVFERTLAERGVTPGALIEVQTREGVREAVAANFGVGIVFESEFGTDARFHKLHVADANLAVAEYAVCLQEQRRVALVRAFFEAARELAGK
jgi:LysR family transcriptional regulator, low CO2-responsive transcriptional regulator